MEKRTIELIAISILSILAAFTIISGIEYFLTFRSLLISYDNAVNTIVKHMASTSASVLKNRNNSSSHIINSTEFYTIYFSLNSSEVNTALQQMNTLVNGLPPLSLFIFLTLVFFALYLIAFFRWLCNQIRSLFRIIFSIILFVLSLITFTVLISSGVAFISTSPSALLALAYSLARLTIPSSLVASIPESLIFGIDLALILVTFLSERTSRHAKNSLRKIENLISKAKKDIKLILRLKCLPEVESAISLSYILDRLLDILSTLIRIFVVIILAFSISLSILAYFNEVFLVLDMIFFVNSVQLLALLALLSLSIDTILYFYLRVFELLVDRFQKRSKKKDTEGGN